ncbi:guanylate kinase [Photorhabdus caribbeanensis]|nr:guanylate kinase [Photorhabdus caribbeanensis]
MEDIDFCANEVKSVFLVLSGPGGTGKTSLIKRWLNDCPDLGYVPNITTRAPRPKSIVDESGFYKHVSRSEFREMVSKNMFAQWVNPSSGKYYGTPIAPLQEAISSGNDLVFDYTPQLYLNLRRQFRQHVVGIFIVPPTLSELMNRLSKRGTEQGEELHIKQNMALQDLAYVDEHDYHVVNDDFEQTLQTLKCIHTSERCRMSRIIGLQERCRAVSPHSMMFYYDPLNERLANMADE